MSYQGKRTAGAVARSGGGVSAPPAPPKKKGKAGKILIALVILLLLAVIGFLVWRFVLHPQVPDNTLQVDPNVGVGTLEKDPAQRQAELDALVSEGMVTIYINATPMYSASKPDQGCNWLIENPEENQNRFTVTVSRNDTGEVVYKTGYLDPGQYIDTAPLDVVPEKGQYECTAIFQTYRISDNSAIGQAGAELTLYIVD